MHPTWPRAREVVSSQRGQPKPNAVSRSTSNQAGGPPKRLAKAKRTTVTTAKGKLARQIGTTARSAFEEPPPGPGRVPTATDPARDRDAASLRVIDAAEWVLARHPKR